MIILLFLSVGKIISSYLPFAFPGSIIGLILLFSALNLRLIKVEWIMMSGSLLLKYMALLFVPIGVGLINHLALIFDNWFVITFSFFFTTLLILLSVGHLYQFLNKKEDL
ncbi:CidA/LrgA family protein [Psychromonas ingrahamii]|uniref:CidA/LrgA family protein n=1 Tax=Psychromonas ingrahamii TaxID=357794 RepID=UPI001E4BCE04|nr:CidA/LrgA family protein [Psychromonas ingrahamii]